MVLPVLCTSVTASITYNWRSAAYTTNGGTVFLAPIVQLPAPCLWSLSTILAPVALAIVAALAPHDYLVTGGIEALVRYSPAIAWLTRDAFFAMPSSVLVAGTTKPCGINHIGATIGVCACHAFTPHTLAALPVATLASPTTSNISGWRVNTFSVSRLLL